MNLLHPTACNFMVYKDYKINSQNLYFQYVESTSGSNTSPVLLSIIVSPSITIFFEVPPKRVLSLYHPLTFDHILFINGLLLSKFIQARHTGGGIWTKNNLLVLCDGVFDGFFKLFFCFHAVSTGYIQLFCKF